MHSMKTLPLAAAFLLTGAVCAQTQWINYPAPVDPGNRAGHDIVATNGPAVLFGGQSDQTTYLDDTWTFDSTTLTWAQVPPGPAPSVRSAFEMAYDPIRDRVVLFGGWNGGLWLNDTWEWDGTNWLPMSPVNSPEVRDWHAMAFDPVSQTVIMFGGHNLNRWPAGPNTLGDMWSWDGNDWTQLSPATMPFMRFGHEMVLDQKRNRVVMWGGSSRQSSAVGAVSHFETWEWDGSNWTQITTANTPTANTFMGLVYDPRRERVVCYGGIVSGSGIGEVWEYDGNDWTQRTLVGTPLVVGHTDGYFDAALGRVVNFGGATVGNRSTTLNATDFYGPVHDATGSSYGTGCAGSAGTPTLACGELAWIGGTWAVDLSSAPANAPIAVLVGFSAVQTSTGQSLPLDLTIIGMPGCRLYTDPMVSLGAAADPTGNVTVSLSVPADPNLIGGDMFSQAMVIDPGVNALSLTTSNGCAHHFGDR